jgi:spore germination protein GerM
MRRWGLVGGMVVLAAAVGVAGCGVPSDSRPRTLSASGVPFGLLAPTTPTSTEPSGTDSAHLPTADIYFLAPAGGPLVSVRHTVADPITLTSVLEALLSGPSQGEQAAGFESLISTQTKLQSAQVVDGVAHVDVSREFLEVSGPEQIVALAQIVYTATALPGVNSVAFSIDGKPREVPTQDGTLTQKPLTRNDYGRLAAH